MKIVLINDRLNAGGAEKVLVYIANLLYEKGIVVEVVLLLQEAALDKELDSHIPVHYLRRKSRFSFTAFRKLRGLVKDADIVHVHSRYNLRYYMFSKYVFRISKPRVFFHEHIPSFEIDFITRILISKVDAYVAVENKMRRWAVEKKIIDNTKAFYLPNTVVKPKTEIPYNSLSKKIVMVANFRPQKNHFFAIELMEQIPLEFSLDLYGMIDDPNYFYEVTKMIEKKNLQSRIHIIQGVSDIYSKLGLYKLAIHTAHAETGPLVLVEYLYAGIPFITFNTGDVVSMIKDNLDSYIEQTFSIDNWKKKVLEFLTGDYHPNLKLHKKQLQDFFSDESYFDKLNGIYYYIKNR